MTKLDPASHHRHIMGTPMGTSSMRLQLAALLVSISAVQAQPAASPSAELGSRADANATQALDTAAQPSWQPPPLTFPEPPVKKQEGTGFDPNAIHYPYGRTSLGNVDPSSAANPYSPYGSLPNQSFGSPAAIPVPVPRIFHGGMLGGRH
jgi:hypothetical protein